MLRVPSKAFLFSGFGESDFHPLEAFDKALSSAGVHEYNLVYYSSILPSGIAFVEGLPELPRGTELPVVLAKESGVRGEFVAAAIGYALSDIGGIVVETHAKGPNPDSLLMSGTRLGLEGFLEKTEELAIRLLKSRGYEPDEYGVIYAAGKTRSAFSYAVAGVAFFEFRPL